MRSTSVIEVNDTAIEQNLAVVRQLVGPDCRLCPIVKADAYGLGAVRIARRLVVRQADIFAVYAPDEAAELLQHGIAADILILMPVTEIGRRDVLYRGLVSGRIHLTVHDDMHLGLLSDIADRNGLNLSLHVKVDSGMRRGGATPEMAAEMIRRIDASRRLRLAGVMTHFADPSGCTTKTDAQLAVLDELIDQTADVGSSTCLVHAANSFATFSSARYHKTMVRIGLAWAGYVGSRDRPDQQHPLAANLTPAVTWTSKIVQIKRLCKGDMVGYGGTWTAKQDGWMGVVPVGYADGYPPSLSHRDDNSGDGKSYGEVGILNPDGRSSRRRFAPVIGAVSMDQLCIDLTHLFQGRRPQGRGYEALRSAAVELISPDTKQPNHVPTIASRAGITPHELLSRLHQRIPRVHFSAAAKSQTEKEVCPMKQAVAG